jgi:adenylate cyclase
VDIRQQDELGELAEAVNQMSKGLSERDRIRDLLGKVVSPQIAAEMLEKGVELGGEDREATILFTDIRNFTTLSETLPPGQVIGLLNTYLTRMTEVIERNGGVVDKYVGEVMVKGRKGATRIFALTGIQGPS